jgi:hypothetical protein
MDRRDALKALAGTAGASVAAAQEKTGGTGTSTFFSMPAAYVPTYSNKHGVEHPVIEFWRYGPGIADAKDKLTFAQFIQRDVYGYTVLWTGWKTQPLTVELVGQWVAVKAGSRYGHFAATGGTNGQYEAGLAMDPTWSDSSRAVTVLSEYEEKARVYLQTFEELMALIEPKG